MQEPLLSVITPCLNRADYLGEAIDSVRSQTGVECEHIIVDGASTDSTPAVLARYPHLRVISEPDRGLYDAINKGVRVARGGFIAFLNSDDLYAPGAFEHVRTAPPEVEVISGGAHVFDDAAGVVREVLRRREIALNLRNVLSGTPLLNARFFRRSFIERIGEFDLAFPIAADREWLFRAALARPREAIAPELFYRYRQHDGSLTFDVTDRSALLYREEHVAFAEKHLSASVLPPDIVRQVRRYHRRESCAVAAAHWRAGRRDQARRWVARGRAQSWLWPCAFARRLLGQALGF